MGIDYQTILLEVLHLVHTDEDINHATAIRGAWAREWERHLAPIKGDPGSGYAPFDMPTEDTFLRSLLLESLSLNADQLDAMSALVEVTDAD